MAKYMTKTAFTVGLLTLLMSVPAFGATINKSIHIEAGENSGGASSVNGSITVGSDAVVTGTVRTVNGSIRVNSGAQIESAKTTNGGVRIADQVRAENLKTVNGAIVVGEGSVVSGEIKAVNGSITVEDGVEVAEDVKNVNGRIELSGSTVGGNVATVSGDVHVVDGSVVRGDIHFEEPGGWSWKNKSRKPKVVIGPGSSVEGVINVEREIEIYISDSASVGGITGEMSMDDAVRFSGDKP